MGASADSVRAEVPIEREDGPDALAPRRAPQGWHQAGFVLDRRGLPGVADLVVPWPPLHGNVIPRAIHGAPGPAIWGKSQWAAIASLPQTSVWIIRHSNAICEKLLDGLGIKVKLGQDLTGVLANVGSSVPR
jgi:hypothetical protein